MERKSILVVDDNPDIREGIQFALETEGYEVLTAANGKEGMDFLVKVPLPGLILLDLMMPVMDGWQFIEILNQNSTLAAIPVVIVTAFADRIKSIRAHGIIKKPIELDEIFQVVRRFCG